ncbi:MAG: tetratricopeptide repeat protein [Isosphaeraceae bacterium]|nr:tetratricopeptide repeat protein [Isosphaeraceae bacterium]
MKLTARFALLIAIAGGFAGSHAAVVRAGDWKAEHDAGWKAYREGRLEEAEKELRAAEKDAKAFGAEDPRFALTLDHLAWVLLAEGKSAEALTLAKAALVVREKKPGTKDEDLAASLNTVASILDHEGKTAEARPYYAKCLEVAIAGTGPENAGVAAALDNLAVADHLLGNLEAAAASYTKALALRTKLGQSPADIAPTMHNLAALRIDEKKYDEAKEILGRVLEMRTKALGADHPDVASTLEALGWTHELQGDAAKAEELLKKAVDLYAADLGADHPHVARAVAKLGRAHLDQGEPAEAEACCKKALTIYEKAGIEGAELASLLEDHASILDKLGRKDEAEKVRAKAKQLHSAKP